MSALPQVWMVDNRAWAEASPRLSVLVPFFRDDPRALLTALGREPMETAGAVEVVLLDDGGGDDPLAQGVTEAVLACPLPARFVRLAANEGRAKGRNRLAAHARSGHLLFLDADMLPDSPRFLAHWLSVAQADPAVAFGGFSVKQAPRTRATALHRAMSLRSDCAPAAARRQTPEKYVFTSNLLVRRDVFETEGFDEGFRGWGWEDVEWGVRVARRHRIAQVDNAATHMGLDPAPVLAAKYAQSAANFGRISRAHPGVVRAWAAHRAARLLRPVPLKRLWRPLLKAVALSEIAPVPVRAFSLRLYRAALCAETI